MTTRKRLTERQVIEVAIRQGAIIPCGICRLALKLEDVPFVERDHERCKHTIPDEDMHLWDGIERQRYVHGRNDPRHDCHAKKTAEDRRIRDKVKRLRGETKAGQKAKIHSRNTLTKEERDKAKQWWEARR